MEAEELIELLASLRQEIRNAHEVLKDLRDEIKRAEKQRKEFMTSEEIDLRLAEEVKRGLASYDEALKTAIEDATQRTFDRFDILTAICLGTDPKSVRRGAVSIPDLLRNYINEKGLPLRLEDT